MDVEAGDRREVREEAGLGKIRVGLEVIGAREEVGLDCGEEAQGGGELETGNHTLIKVEVLEELATSSCCWEFLIFLLTVDIDHSIHIPVDIDHNKVRPIF